MLLQFVILPGLALSEELRIPVLVGQTGAASSFGRNETDAYVLAAEEWNKKGGVDGKKVGYEYNWYGVTLYIRD